MSRIFVVEDDPAVRDVVELALSREGLQTVAISYGEEALERLREADPFDLVVLDLMLPGMDGTSVCQEIREGSAGEANRDIPIIMLTARNDETSMVVGLGVGADDYVTKPFRPRELASRVRAHLRRRRRVLRGGSQHQSKLEFPGLIIDLLKREVIGQAEPVSLSASQFKVLELLASSPGQVFSRRQIMDHLWEGNFYGEERSADVHVHGIRRKIEPDPQNPRYLLSVRGVGYRFADLS